MSVIPFNEPGSSIYAGTSPFAAWHSRFAGAGSLAWRVTRAAVRVAVLAIIESRMRRAAKDLQQLDDRMLRDIGLKRSEIDRAVRYGRADELTPYAAEWCLWNAGWPDEPKT